MDNKFVTLKDLREKFYALRDLEIQNLWQRASIFAGLIGLFFAGYGYILLNHLDPKQRILAHILCCGIASLAIIFSVIWIAMAKGAKAWFEVQERKICEIEESEELNIPLRFRMGALPYPGAENEPDCCLLSTKAGRFSVSKLNILLGQALLICWSIIFFLHSFILLRPELSCIKEIIPSESSLLNVVQTDSWNILAGWTVVLVVACSLVMYRGRSGALLTEKEYLNRRADLFRRRVEVILKNTKLVDTLLGSIPLEKLKEEKLSDKNKRDNLLRELTDTSLNSIPLKANTQKKIGTEISVFFKEVISIIAIERGIIGYIRMLIAYSTFKGSTEWVKKTLKKCKTEFKEVISIAIEREIIGYIRMLIDILAKWVKKTWKKCKKSFTSLQLRNILRRRQIELLVNRLKPKD